MRTEYLIARTLISVEAPQELIDNDGYELYRFRLDDVMGKQSLFETGRMQSLASGNTESNNKYEVLLIEDEKSPSLEGKVLFKNEMNLYLLQDNKTIHFFRMPMTRQVAAWCEKTGQRSVTIHYKPFAKEYFRQSVGCFNALSFESIMYETGKYLFHCSYVDVDGAAVLFSASSGGGKTTHGLLWEKCRCGEMLNGDRAILEKDETDKSEKNRYVVHGLPIAGSSNVFKNRSLPLKAIFMLEKAPMNEVIDIAPGRQFIQVFEQMTVHTWDREFINAAVDFVADLIQKVPVRLLRCTPDEEAVWAVRDVLDN